MRNGDAPRRSPGRPPKLRAPKASASIPWLPSVGPKSALGVAVISTATLVFLGVSVEELVSVVGPLSTVGFGVVLYIASHAGTLLIDSAAWRVLFIKDRIRFSRLYLHRWLGESVNNILPVAQVGGEVVRARGVACSGVSLGTAASTVVVDVAIGLIAMVAFAAPSLGILTRGRADSLLWGGLAFLMVPAALLVGLPLVTRSGASSLVLRRAARALGLRDMYEGPRIEGAIETLYGAPIALVAALGLRALGRVALGAELFLASRCLGLPASFEDALLLTSVVDFMRAAIFFVPGGLVVQEGGFVLVGAMLGFSAESMVALALMRRARELALGLPGVIVLGGIERRRARAHV